MSRPVPLSRYRRRAWTIGVVLALALFVVGAPRYVSGIEDDLEREVPEALAELGIVGTSASFSGQSGTLTCLEPLADPELALATAFDVRGVRDVELDRSCRVRGAPLVDGTATTVDDDTATTTGVANGADEAAETTIVSETNPSPEAELSIAELVDSDSDLTLLSMMVSEADLLDVLTGAPLTLLAPTNTAFDALPADVLAVLRSDPERLEQVLEHHIVNAELSIAEIAGVAEVVPRSGDPIAIEPGDPLLIGGAPLAVGDVRASNGVIHQVDAVIVPDGVDLRPSTGPPVEVQSSDGVVTLTGVVATEVERLTLTQAAAAGGDTVTDEMTVDPDVGLDDATASALAGLVEALTIQLVDGVAGFDGNDLFLRGTYTTDDQRDAAEAAAIAVEAELDLGVAAASEPAPQAESTEIEDGLNALVADTPILFAPGSNALVAGAAPVLDELAGRLAGLDSVLVTVEGHTDSDGDAADNLALSQRRADAVVQALIDRGVEPGLIVAEGFGSTEPVLVDGVEDKTASRRVEFRVVASS